MLVDGALSPDVYTPERLQDRRILDIADKVRVVVDPGFDAAYPQHLGAAVALMEVELEEKFRMLADRALGRERAGQVASLISRLPDLETVRPLADVLRASHVGDV